MAVKRRKAVKKKVTQKKSTVKAKKRTTRKKPTVKKAVKRKAVKRKVVKRKAVKRKPVKRKVIKKVVRRKKSTSKGGNMPKRRKKRSVKRAAKRVYSYAKNKGIMGTLIQGGAVVAGAIGAGVSANAIPLPDDRLKPILPIIAGVLLSNLKPFKNPTGKMVAAGMIAAGGLALVKKFAPQVPLLAGEDSAYLDYLPEDMEDEAMLGQVEVPGELDYYGGEEDDFIEDEGLDGDSLIMGEDAWMTPGNL